MDIGEQLAGWGKAALLETRGRKSGLAARAHVGFVEEPDGSIVVAAGLEAHWAANLLADPACVVTIGDRSFPGIAEALDGVEFASAIRELILRYGTPAERLGSGPAFRIRPVAFANEAADESGGHRS
jgi:deazaflavin-dependent oxidoreductase (nitroreductase family)